MLLTEEDYLRIEREAVYKSEYVGGRVVAMPGCTPEHCMLGANVLAELHVKLPRANWRLLSSNMRLRTPATGAYLYPDGSLVRGPVQLYPGTRDVMVNPALVFEVLSPSTADYDRGEKFELYREIPALRNYLVVHQNAIYIEHWSRQPDGSWLLREYKGEDARIPLPGIECELHLGSIYDGVMDEPV